MKTIKEKGSFILKLGMTAAVMLFTQHALAAGTTAGTDVDNLATVNYEVGGAPQTLIESSPLVGGNSTPGLGAGLSTSFEVDNRVDFTLVEIDGLQTPVAPGETDAFVAFTLTNDGNSEMDFRLVATQLGSVDGAVNGEVDTDVDMDIPLRIRVANGDGAVGVPDLAERLGISRQPVVTDHPKI